MRINRTLRKKGFRKANIPAGGGKSKLIPVPKVPKVPGVPKKYASIVKGRLF
jgi:hypothetical protein